MNAASNDHPAAHVIPPTPAATQGWPPPAVAAPGLVAAWLDGCENEMLHPAQVQDRLFRAGWNPEAARGAASAYRARFNQHTLGYTALLVTTGLAALSAGTAGHILAAGLQQPVDRDALAWWLTVLACSLPRRSLATVLLWGCGVIGVGRLLVYTAQLIGVIVGASWAEGISLATGAVNVSITVGIALPLGLWAHRFLHRFDTEDPTAPASRTRPSAAKAPAAPRPQGGGAAFAARASG